MSALLPAPAERARNAFSRILRRMEEPGTGQKMAQAIGTSETSISRTKTEKLQEAVALICHLGFKIVDADRICVDKAKFEAIATIARAAMSCEVTTNRLIWEDE